MKPEARLAVRALDRIAEYAERPLEEFVKERRLKTQQELVAKFTDLWDAAMKQQLEAIRLIGKWGQSFELDFSDQQKLLDEAKELLAQIQSDTTLIEKMEADSHEQV